MLLVGVLLMLAGDFMFALNDAMGKWLLASLSVGQLVFVRSFGMFLILGPMIARQGPRKLFTFEQPLIQFLRIVATAADTALFYAALATLPLADVMSFYMAGPIYVAALSHFMLGERVGWRRWMAILIGFIGVLIILKPTGTLSAGSLYALIGSIGFGFSIIFSRMLRGVSDTNLVTWQTVATMIIGGVMSIGNWLPGTAIDWVGTIAMGVVAAAAHLLIVRALKLAPASTLAPLHYTLLLWAALFGWAFFNDVPTARIWLGSAVIVLAGLFIVHRQNVVATVPPENVPKGVN